MRSLEHPPDRRAAISLRRSSLVIGPEGGWIDREIASLQERAFLSFRLGEWILRSELAVTAAIAQIDLLRQMATGVKGHADHGHKSSPSALSRRLDSQCYK